MRAKIRTLVSFKSTAFNMTGHRSYFINPGCFGDDVAKWLSRELRDRGVNVDDKPGQEDFGWYFNFQFADKAHTFVVGYRPDDRAGEGTWIGWIERRRGLVGSLLGARKREIDPAAAETLHSILSSSSQIQDIRWHLQQDFEKGHEDRGVPEPQSAPC